ncbi:MAG: hypothetical protein JO140_02525, partial [Candidatus Eremiobacteraeota bacterium]|nr:hypothetical protein [Candidatus Eremiobacteraeota bacterium]
MIALVLAAALATVAQATPAAGPPVSKELQALKDSVATYFHKANDAFGGPRPYFFYAVSKDESGLIVN